MFYNANLWKWFQLCIIAAIIQSCDLGDFEPINAFTREPLEDDALSLETGTGCNFDLLVNNDRFTETNQGISIKGSVYLQAEGEPFFLTSGEFTLTTDTEGKISAFEGFGTASFPETLIFENAIAVEDFPANISLIIEADFSNFFSLETQDTSCYLYFNIDRDTAFINTDNGDFSFTQMYYDPIEPFLLFEGDIDLPSLKSNFGWIGISYDGNIEFLPENFTPELTIDPFNGHIYTDGELPFIVNEVNIISTGKNIINAGFNNEGPQSFFEGSNGNIEQGTNGNLEIAYEMVNKILSTYTFYEEADTASRINEHVILNNATSHWTSINGVEAFSFVGTFADTTNLYQEILLSHPILERLQYSQEDEPIIFGNYGTNFNLWAFNILNTAVIDLDELGEYSFRDAILSVTTDGIGFSGIFESPFRTLPNTLVAGDIEESGDFILNGQNLFAVNFNGTTLPVTFSVSIIVADGNPTINISGQAEYCENNNCQFLPVSTQLDIENQTLELCVTIPNTGLVCIQ